MLRGIDDFLNRNLMTIAEKAKNIALFLISVLIGLFKMAFRR